MRRRIHRLRKRLHSTGEVRGAPHGRVAVDHSLGNFTVSVPIQEHSERADIVLKPQPGKSVEDVLGADSLPMLAVAALVRFGGDEADELGGAFLEEFFGVFGNLGM